VSVASRSQSGAARLVRTNLGKEWNDKVQHALHSTGTGVAWASVGSGVATTARRRCYW
jgi:hypothetical protein